MRADRAARACRINGILAQLYPDAHCELTYRSPFELLVATVLSAQCTDVRVNQVTPELLRRYPTPEALAAAHPAELEAVIRPVGFYRAKARNLLGLAETLVAQYGGEVPRDMSDLVGLPGVGRKTAHVVRGNAFGLPGLTVDTHFGRLVRRMGLTEQTNPVRVERDIAQLIDESEWTMFSHRLIFHGRRVCHSRTAACGVCPVVRLCPAAGTAGPADPKAARSLVKPEDLERLDGLAEVSHR